MFFTDVMMLTSKFFSSYMKSIQIIGVGAGVSFIMFFVWFGLLLELETSASVASLFFSIITVFNCLVCLVWMYAVVKTEFKNRQLCLLSSAIWMGLNVIFIPVLRFALFFSSEPNASQIYYLFAVAVVILALFIYAIIAIVSYQIMKSLKAIDLSSSRSYVELDSYRSQMYVKRLIQNWKHRIIDGGQIGNFMAKINASNQWKEAPFTITAPVDPKSNKDLLEKQKLSQEAGSLHNNNPHSISFDDFGHCANDHY